MTAADQPCPDSIEFHLRRVAFECQARSRAPLWALVQDMPAVCACLLDRLGPFDVSLNDLLGSRHASIGEIRDDRVQEVIRGEASGRIRIPRSRDRRLRAAPKAAAARVQDGSCVSRRVEVCNLFREAGWPYLLARPDPRQHPATSRQVRHRSVLRPERAGDRAGTRPSRRGHRSADSHRRRTGRAQGRDSESGCGRRPGFGIEVPSPSPGTSSHVVTVDHGGSESPLLGAGSASARPPGTCTVEVG